MNITPEIVREFFVYDIFTGKLYWKYRDRKWFKSDGPYKTWNKRFAGKEAFTSIDANGYRHGTLFGRPQYAHRII